MNDAKDPNEENEMPDTPETELSESDADTAQLADGEAEAPAELPSVESLQASVAELQDKLLRAMAETENTRRIGQREKADAAKFAIANFAREMVGVADNLGRALSSVAAEDRKTDEALNTLCEGVEMTERAMLAAFEKVGIARIAALGQRFDPNLHEAMFEMPDESQPHGTVAQVIEEGYILADRLLRPSKVGVTKGGPKPEAPQERLEAEDDGAQSSDSQGQSAYEQGEAGSGGTGKNVDTEL